MQATNKEKKFQVGDRVYCGDSIGTIIKISPKVGRITVDFGDYTTTFSKDGYTNLSDPYYVTCILPLTSEIEKTIREKKLIQKCRKMAEEMPLTAQKAQEIIDILER